MSTFDLITVTFEKEYPLLEVQAKSIAQFLDLNIGRIIVINNSPGKKPNIDPDWYGKYKHKFRLHSAQDFLNKDDPCIQDGYKSQMLLKIKASNRCISNYLCILDNKNWFINHINEERLLKGRKIIGTNSGIGDVWKDQWNNALSIMGLSADQYSHKNYSNITPFFARRETFNTINRIIPTISRDIKDLKYTEFNIIMAYILKHHGWENYYFQGAPKPKISLSSCLYYIDQFTKSDPNYIIEYLKGGRYNTTDNLLCSGLHRRLWDSLTHEEKQDIAEWWVELGLFTSSNPAMRIIEQMASLNKS